MDKTIKEVAEMLGVSKQAIQYHVKTLPTNCYQVITKGKQKQIMIKPSGLQVLRERVTNKEVDKQKTNTNKQTTKNDKEKIDLNQDLIEIFKEQLNAKDDQIKDLTERLKEANELNKNSQILLLKANEKIDLLEHKEQEQEQNQEPKKWYQFWK